MPRDSGLFELDQRAEEVLGVEEQVVRPFDNDRVV
jgi:hypothetical protein